MPRRKMIVFRNETGGLKLPEGANERMDDFQREIVSFRTWLAEHGLVLEPVEMVIRKII